MTPFKIQMTMHANNKSQQSGYNMYKLWVMDIMEQENKDMGRDKQHKRAYSRTNSH